MPIFIKNKAVFIHIPKTGGSSIEEEFKSSGDSSIFCSESSYLNGHSPQHSTYEELKKFGLIPDGFKVFSVVRHPYDRFVSEYNYRYNKSEPETLEDFTKRFCGMFRKEYDWDNHHLSCSEFIYGKPVEIIRFENLKVDFKKMFGFELTKHEMKRDKILTINNLNDVIRERIYNIWKEDFKNFNYKE